MGNHVTAVGVVGCGDVAQLLYLPMLAEFHREGKLRVISICDKERSRIEQSLKVLPPVRSYSEYDDFLDDDELEVVVNLTPIPLHVEFILRAIDAKKHVYTEKVLAPTVEEADRLINAAKEAGVKIAAAPALMTHPVNQEVKRLIEEGAIGDVCFVRAQGSHSGLDRIMDYTSDGRWVYGPGGGALFELGVYPLHGATGIIGPAKRVVALSGCSMSTRRFLTGAAKGEVVESVVDDNTQILLDFGDACFAHVDATFVVLSNRGPAMEIYGTRGVINIHSRHDKPPFEIFLHDIAREVRGWLEPEPVFRGHLQPPITIPGRQAGWSLPNGVTHFVECIEQGHDPIISGEHARHVIEIMTKASESAKSGEARDLQTTFGGPATGRETTAVERVDGA